MSLFRQLWLAVILVTLTSFTGSFAVSMLSARSYLEQQLHRKNIDSANSLALSISQLSKDTVTIGLQIAALFDSGQYETYLDYFAGWQGDRRTDTGSERYALFPNGLLISSPSAPRRASLRSPTVGCIWRHQGGGQRPVSPIRRSGIRRKLMIWFLAAGILSGLIGILILQRIKRPLAAMVESGRGDHGTALSHHFRTSHTGTAQHRTRDE